MTILGIFLNKEMRTGANRRYLELMESLAAKGNRVYVIMNTLLEYTPVSFTKIPLTVPYKRRGFPPASFLFRKAVKRCYDTEICPVLEQAGGVEWVHIHGDMHLNAALYLCSVTGAPLFYAFRCNDITRARILRKSGSLSFREYLFSLLYEQVNRRREKLVARKARLTAFQNICDRDLYCERTGADKNTTVIIPGNIGLPRCTPEWENTNKETSPEKLVFAGGISLSKGLYHMLKAFALVTEQTGRNLHLSVLGRGTERELCAAKEAVEELGIQDNISFEGYVNPPFPFFASCGLLVYPTLYDAFPDTVLEALHCGCPVIATNVGGIPDILPQECLFENGHPEQTAALIQRCIEDNGFYLHIRECCLQRAERFRFDWAQAWQNVMEKYMDGLYKNDNQ